MKNKISKIILIILIILIAIPSIYFGRIYVILSKLSNRQKEIFESSNYSYIAKLIDTDGSYTMMEYHYKEGKNLITTLKDNYYEMIWYDENTKELITMYPEELKAYISKVEEKPNSVPLDKVSTSQTFYVKIQKTKINNEEYYILYNTAIDGDKKYFNVKNNEMFRHELSSGKKIEYIFDKEILKNIEKDINRPNLDNYKVIKE